MRTAAVGVVLAALLGASAGWAGEIFRWTDAQGVVHFADVPPPNQPRVETRTMPEPPARPAAEPAPTAAGQSGAGPAQVVITTRAEESLGGSRHGVSGTVENKGGATARGVAIDVRVISPAQGDDCLSEEIGVSPSTLEPGEKADFSAEFDHPCFRGPTQVDLQVHWQ